MKARFTSILKDKCKDFGLTEQAIADLVEMGIEGLTEESSDEDFSKKADSLVHFAKLMQKEITRKSKKTQPKKEEPKKEEPDGGEAGSEDMPAWAKAMQQSLEAMKAENEKLKADAKANDRKAQIQSKAKELGIPEFLMKHYAMADDADIETELTAYKQELVTGNLLPKNAVSEKASLEATMKADAKAFAESLPNK